MSEFLLFHGVAIVILILANGFFVAAEFALVSVRETRVQQMIAERRPGARIVRRLQENLGDFLPAVQLGVTLCSLALGWLGEPAVAGIFEQMLQPMPHARLYAHLAAVPLAFAFITYFEVLLGELVPKALALRSADEMAVAVAGPMDVFIRLTRPVIRLLNRSAALVLRLFHARLTHEGGGIHSPEELKLMATAARRVGMLPEYHLVHLHRAVNQSLLILRQHTDAPRRRRHQLQLFRRVDTATFMGQPGEIGRAHV